jgi:hypothetical protein
MTGAPGRTRTSTMLPLPDFESGASTNSATGAGGGDHSREARGVNGPAPAERAPAKRAPFFRNEAQAHARVRAGAQGSGARSCLLSAIAGPLVWLWVPGLVEFTLGPRVARTRGLARDTRERRISMSRARDPGTRYLGTRPITAFARAE